MRTPKYLGVYSYASNTTEGLRKTLFFAWEITDSFAVQQLDKAFRPTAAPKRVPADVFSEYFQEETSILAMPLTALDEHLLQDASPAEPEPAPRTPQPAVKPASRPPQPTLRAEQPTPKAAQTPAPEAPKASPGADEPAVDESRRRFLTKQTELRLRESFRQALLRLKRPRERQGALTALEHLAQSVDDIVPEHKHAFRDFGVRLRKDSKPDLARLFSERVLELAPHDDHAHFNLARVLCALRLYEEAAGHIHTAINLDPNEVIYARMLAHISKEQLRRRPGVRSTSGKNR